MIGIKREEFELLCTSEARKLIDENIDKEPSALALKGVNATICGQVKYLQRCKQKASHYYEARCVIPPLSYEQSSSMLASLTKKDRGERFLDLTCGLGVDTFHYSKQFKQVTTIERIELLADIAKENFKRLGADNITVINADCEDFINSYDGEIFDLIYVDPARRDSAKRVFLLEDCSPNILDLIPKIKLITKKLIIKLSPLFDMEEAERIFGEGVTLNAISVSDECKELCVEIDFTKNTQTEIIASSVNKKGEIRNYSFLKNEINKLPVNENIEDITEYNYISILDVSLRKMRCCTGYYAKYHPDAEIAYDREIALWHEKPTELAGKIYKIKSAFEYKPKQLKSILTKEGIKNATIIKQNFNMTLDDIRKRIGIKNGDGATIIFTTVKSTQYTFIIETT